MKTSSMSNMLSQFKCYVHLSISIDSTEKLKFIKLIMGGGGGGSNRHSQMETLFPAGKRESRDTHFIYLYIIIKTCLLLY